MTAASSEVTGNLGTTYETQVAAYYLVSVLTGFGGQGLDGARIETLAMQRKVHGDPLDDIVVEGRRPDDQTARLQLQVKTRLEVGLSKGDFQDILNACWEAMTAIGFAVGRDRFGAVTQGIALEAYAAVRKLTEIARLTSDGQTFAANLAAPGQTNAPARRIHRDVTAGLARAAGRSVTPDEIWTFYRHFLLMRIETVGEGASQRTSAIARLASVLTPADAARAEDLFDALEALARQLNARAGKLNGAGLLDRLAGRYAFRADVAPDSIEQITVRARAAAQRDQAAFRAARDLSGAALVPPAFHEEATDGEPNPIDADDISRRLLLAGRLALTAAPGAGKSTAILHLAEHILDKEDLLAPFVLPLPEFASPDMVGDLLLRPDLRPLGRDALEALATAGRLVLLCDGWNEVAIARRAEVRAALTRFLRAFPKAGVLIATRTGALESLGGDWASFELVGLSRPRQLALLDALVGADAEALLNRAEATPGLRELVATPLYLVALGRLNPSDALPSTRADLIAALMKAHQDRVVDHDEFHEVLRGLHTPVLQALAVALVERGTTALSEGEARAAITQASEAARAAGALGAALEPFAVLRALVDHHILVRSDRTTSAVYTLPHEQIQEWLASFRVEERALAARGDAEAERRFLAEIVDRPVWTESILFAIERMGRASDEALAAASRMICRAFGIDRLLAARMVARGGDRLWERIAPVVSQFLEDWTRAGRSVSGSDLAAFLCATARSELRGRLWNLLQADPKLEPQDLDVAGLHALLQSDWDEQAPSLSVSQRRSLVYDFILSGDAAIARFGLEKALADPAFDVFHAAVELLVYDHAEDLDAVVDRIGGGRWAQLATRVSLRHLAPGPFGERLIVEKLKALAGDLPDDARWSLMLQLSEIGVAVDADRLVDLALTTAKDSQNRGTDWLPIILETAPGELSRALAAQLDSDILVPRGLENCLLPSDAPSPERLQELATRPGNGVTNRRLAARLLEVDQVVAILNQMIGMSAGPWTDRTRAVHLGLGDALAETEFETLLRGLEATPPRSEPAIEVLAERAARWRSDQWETRRNPGPVQLARLERLVEDWAKRLLEAERPSRHVISALASVIGRHRLNGRLDTLVALVRREALEMARQKAEQQTRLDAGDSNALRGGTTVYDIMFSQAFDGLEGEVVAEALLGLLDLPTFEAQAAFQLRRFAAPGLDTGRVGLATVPYDRLDARRRETTQAALEPAHPIAALVLDRIPSLLAGAESRDLTRAGSLASAATQMNFGDRLADIEAVLRQDGLPRNIRAAILEGLRLRGLILPADIVYAGLEEAIARVRTKTWTSNQDWWEVRQWLSYAPFTEDPVRLADVLSRLPQEQKKNYQLDDLVHALGYAPSGQGVEALEALITIEPDLKEHSSLPMALAAIGDDNAADALVRAMIRCSDEGVTLDHAWERALEQIASARPAVFDALLAREDWPPHEKVRGILAMALGRAWTEARALMMFDRTWTDRRDPIADSLLDGWSVLALQQVPIEGLPANHYELVPRSVDLLRSRLLREALAGGAKAEFAQAILERLERSRHRHGRPPEEARHPNLASGVPWPPFTAYAWIAAANF